MLRVSEIYSSFQGEGPNTGKPTLFVRFVGCNLKCPGWPCDTQHAIDPKLYRNDMKTYSAEEFTEIVMEQWYTSQNICFTGGEVTLQPAQDLEWVLSRLTRHTGNRPELFTNGTLRWSDGFTRFFGTIVLDWKLPGSGEVFSPVQEDIRLQNLGELRPTDALKFTVKDRADFDLAMRWWRVESTARVPRVYCGPVWGSVTAEEVAGWMVEEGLPWNLNVQTHKFVWEPEARGV